MAAGADHCRWLWNGRIAGTRSPRGACASFSISPTRPVFGPPKLVGPVLVDIHTAERNDRWLHLVGKGGRPGKVTSPPLARTALDQYLVQFGLPVKAARWDPRAPLIASLEPDSSTYITGTRLWAVMRRFFIQAAVGPEFVKFTPKIA